MSLIIPDKTEHLDIFPFSLFQSRKTKIIVTSFQDDYFRGYISLLLAEYPELRGSMMLFPEERPEMPRSFGREAFSTDAADRIRKLPYLNAVREFQASRSKWILATSNPYIVQAAFFGKVGYVHGVRLQFNAKIAALPPETCDLSAMARHTEMLVSSTWRYLPEELYNSWSGSTCSREKASS